MHSFKKDWFMLVQEFAVILIIAGFLAIFVIGITSIGGVRMLPIILASIIPLAIVVCCDRRLRLDQTIVVTFIREHHSICMPMIALLGIFGCYAIVSIAIVTEVRHIDIRHSLSESMNTLEDECLKILE